MSNTFTKTSLRGFTLIELLVVIAIIGLLSTVIAAPITQARKKGRDGKKVADIHQIQGALQQYADDNLGNYAPALTSLVPVYLSILPPFAATSTAGKDKYMYVPYITSDSRTVAFHIGSKLEAASQALQDDRDCYGAGDIDSTHNYCVDASASPNLVFTTASTSNMNFGTTDASDPATPGMGGLSTISNVGAGNINSGPVGSGAFKNMDASNWRDFGGGSDAANTACTANLTSSSTACIYDITNN